MCSTFWFPKWAMVSIAVKIFATFAFPWAFVDTIVTNFDERIQNPRVMHLLKAVADYRIMPLGPLPSTHNHLSI